MAKRITSTAVKWSFLNEVMLPEDLPRIATLKSMCDKLMRQISEKPADLPKIDWSYYKARISAPGMVDAFQKGYEGLKIPYPSDQGVLAETEASNKEYLVYADEGIQEILRSIDKYKKELKEKEDVMRYADMTMEELYLARPDLKIDPDNPKLWPPNLDEIVGRKTS